MASILRITGSPIFPEISLLRNKFLFLLRSWKRAASAVAPRAQVRPRASGRAKGEKPSTLEEGQARCWAQPLGAPYHRGRGSPPAKPGTQGPPRRERKRPRPTTTGAANAESQRHAAGCSPPTQSMEQGLRPGVTITTDVSPAARPWVSPHQPPALPAPHTATARSLCPAPHTMFSIHLKRIQDKQKPRKANY